MHDPTREPPAPEERDPAWHDASEWTTAFAPASGARMTTVDLDDMVRRVPHSVRSRALQVSGILALIALALGIIANQLARAQPPAPPSETVAASHPVVLVSNVSFGVVTLNGTRLRGAPPVLLPLRQGRNQITLSAPPFAPRSCQLSWSSSELKDTGDCVAEGRFHSVRIDGQFIEPDLVVVLIVSATDLSPALGASARQAIIGALAQVRLGTVNMGPDEFLATGGFFPQEVTTEPTVGSVQASIGFALPNQSPDTNVLSDCPELICVGTPLMSQIATPDLHWAVTLGAGYRWTYTDVHGTVVASSLYYPLGPPASVQVMLVAQPAGGWAVVGAITPDGSVDATFGSWNDLLCAAGMDVLQAITQAYRGYVNVIQNRGITGCELLLRAVDSPATGRFIWRCGVLLAADQSAHASLPGATGTPASVLKLFP